MLTEESNFKSRLSTSKSEYSSNELFDSGHRIKKSTTFFSKNAYEVKPPEQIEARPIIRKKASRTVINPKPRVEITKLDDYESKERKTSSEKEFSPNQTSSLKRRSSNIEAKIAKKEFDAANDEPFRFKAVEHGDNLIRKEEKKKPKLSRLETKVVGTSGSLSNIPPLTAEKCKRSEATWEDVFGSFLKEIKLKKSSEEVIFEKKEKRASILENPYFINKPINNKTDIVHTNPNYVRDFGDFLDGKISIEDFVNKNNFPRILEEKKKRKEIQMVRLVGFMFKMLNTEENIEEIIYETEKMIEGRGMDVGRDSLLKRSASEERKHLEEESKKQNNNSKVKRLLDLMRNIIKVKIEKRRNLTIMKKHQEVRNWRFFQSFLDITNQYLMKIQNGDLQNGISDSKYYLMSSQKKRTLKECFMLTPSTDVRKQTTKLTDYRNMKKSIKYQMNENVSEFLSSLEDSKRNKEVYRKHVLKKTIKRQGDSIGLDVIHALNHDHVSLNEIEKEKIANTKVERSRQSIQVRVRKTRKNLYNHDLELWDYLLNSKIITKHEEAADIRLKDFDGTEDFRSPEKNGKFIRHSAIENNKRMGFFTSRSEKDDNDFFIIKRNKVIPENKIDVTEEEQGNESLISMTEVKMDQLYNESRGLQKRIVSMQRDGFGKKIKQLIKLEDINEYTRRGIWHI